MLGLGIKTHNVSVDVGRSAVKVVFDTSTDYAIEVTGVIYY